MQPQKQQQQHDLVQHLCVVLLVQVHVKHHVDVHADVGVFALHLWHSAGVEQAADGGVSIHLDAPPRAALFAVDDCVLHDPYCLVASAESGAKARCIHTTV